MFKKISLCLTSFWNTGSFASAKPQLTSAALLKMDEEWENSILVRDIEWLNSNLSEDFIWVHNHASETDTKTSLLNRMAQPADVNDKSRKQSEVTVKILESTAIVMGFSVVDRDSELTKFHFMRTYVLVNGKCRLLANHTMRIPEK